MRHWWGLLYGLTVAGVLASAWLGSQTVTVIAETDRIQRCIVIDPGHGGVDGGAVSCTGRPESGYNLEISLRLRDLMDLLGFRTRMIRTTDVSVYTQGQTIAQKKLSDLKHRLQMIRREQGPLVLSIHQNQFPESRYSGAQVFYAPTEGSRDLAARQQTAFREHLKSTRQEKPSRGVYLMEHLPCTGVLIECGFLSNPREEALLSDPAYQKKLCCVIACATAQYLLDPIGPD